MSGLLTSHIETCADESTRKFIVSSWDTEAAKLYPEWLKSGKRDNLICLTSRCAMECLLAMLLSDAELTESELSTLAAEGLAQVSRPGFDSNTLKFRPELFVNPRVRRFCEIFLDLAFIEGKPKEPTKTDLYVPPQLNGVLVRWG